VVLLLSVSLCVYFLVPGLPGKHRVSSDGFDYAVERISQSRFNEMTAWGLGIEERLLNLLGFQPNSDGTLLLYQTGVNGSEVRLFDTDSREDRLIYRLEVADPALMFDYRCSAFWLGTYDDVIITEYAGDLGPYKVFRYDLVSGALRELPASLFIHPELNLNSEGVKGSPPGTELLVVQSSIDARIDGLYLCKLSGERVAEIYSGRRGTFGLCGVSEGTILLASHEGSPNEFGEVGASIYLYDLATRAVTPVPASGVAMTPMFRPGANTVTFAERDSASMTIYLKEYETHGGGQPRTLLELADGGGGYCWASYCWSIDGKKLYVIEP